MIPTYGEPFFLDGGPLGCLLIHDILGTPLEMRWLGVQLNEAGFSVLGLRLFGHATHGSDLRRARWLDWLASVQDGFSILRDRCDEKVIIGLAQGGALALIAAASMPLAGAIALCTPFRALPHAEGSGEMPIKLALRSFGFGGRSLPPSANLGKADLQGRAGHSSHAAPPKRAMAEMERLLMEMRRVLPNVNIPVLLIHSDSEQAAFQQSTGAIFDALGTKKAQILRVGDSDQLAALESAGDRAAAAMIAFITNLCGSNP